MSWVKLDDRFFDNPKIAALSDQAKLAYLEGLTYCARELTDGFIPANKAKAYAGKAKVLTELTPHLWEPATGGYRAHDYLEYNPTREQVLHERDAAKRRMNAFRSGRTTGVGTEPPVKPVSPSPKPVAPEPDPRKPVSAAFAPFDEHPDDLEGFPSVYRRSHEQLTRKPITSYRMADAIELNQKYGSEECIAVASLLGWDKAPKYYIGKLEERSGKHGQDSGRQPAEIDSAGVANRFQRVDQREPEVASSRRHRTI